MQILSHESPHFGIRLAKDGAWTIINTQMRNHNLKEAVNMSNQEQQQSVAAWQEPTDEELANMSLEEFVQTYYLPRPDGKLYTDMLDWGE